MTDYRIIDVHNHIYPEKIAEKASESVGKFYNMDMSYKNATAEELLKSAAKIGTEKIVICSAATTEAQVTHINDFIIEQCSIHSEFIGFGTLHPDFADANAEIKRIMKQGIRGIKLHPDFQNFFIDDYSARPMWQAIADNGMFVLVHLGDDKRPYSDPYRMVNVLNDIPNIKLIAAHFGGYRVWERAYDAYKPGTCWFDISSSIGAMEKGLIFKFFDKFGIENFFWGTDFPAEDHETELKKFFDLGLSEEQNRMILGENFASVFGI